MADGGWRMADGEATPASRATHDTDKMKVARKEAGFGSYGFVETKIGIAVLGIVLAVLWPWASGLLQPVPIASRAAELVAPAVASTIAVPSGWRVVQDKDGSTVIQRQEPEWQRWIAPVLLFATAVAIFLTPLAWSPFWILLAALCGVLGYGIHLRPVEQSLKIAANGSVEMSGTARFSAIMGKSETVYAENVDTVLVHKEQPVAYFVYLKRGDRTGWRIYADSSADARAIAALVQSRLKPKPPADKPADKK